LSEESTEWEGRIFACGGSPSGPLESFMGGAGPGVVTKRHESKAPGGEVWRKSTAQDLTTGRGGTQGGGKNYVVERGGDKGGEGWD